jgi:hypothetical protein
VCSTASVGRPNLHPTIEGHHYRIRIDLPKEADACLVIDRTTGKECEDECENCDGSC